MKLGVSLEFVIQMSDPVINSEDSDELARKERLLSCLRVICKYYFIKIVFITLVWQLHTLNMTYVAVY
jgi:hypothetical protein